MKNSYLCFLLPIAIQAASPDIGLRPSSSWIATNLLTKSNAATARSGLGVSEWTTNIYMGRGDSSSSVRFGTTESPAYYGVSLQTGTNEVILHSDGHGLILTTWDGLTPYFITDPSEGAILSYKSLTNLFVRSTNDVGYLPDIGGATPPTTTITAPVWGRTRLSQSRLHSLSDLGNQSPVATYDDLPAGLNVVWYGAVADGRDNWIAVSNALIAARAVNSSVYFPKGQWMIGQRINLNGGSIHMKGEGPNKSIIFTTNYTRLSDTGTHATNYSNFCLFSFRQATNIVIDGLTFNSGETFADVDEADPVHHTYCWFDYDGGAAPPTNYTTIKNSLFMRARQAAIRHSDMSTLRDSTVNLSVYDSTFYGLGWDTNISQGGVFLNNGGTQIFSRNTFKNCGNFGSGLTSQIGEAAGLWHINYDVDGRYMTFTENVVIAEMETDPLRAYAIDVEATGSALFANNIWYGNQRSAITLVTQPAGSSTLITGNQLNNAVFNGLGIGGDVVIEKNVVTWTWNRNGVVGVNQGSQRCYVLGSANLNLLEMKGNTFVGTDFGALGIPYATNTYYGTANYGVGLETVNNAVLDGNTFIAYPSFSLRSSTNVLFRNNSVVMTNFTSAVSGSVSGMEVFSPSTLHMQDNTFEVYGGFTAYNLRSGTTLLSGGGNYIIGNGKAEIGGVVNRDGQLDYRKPPRRTSYRFGGADYPGLAQVLAAGQPWPGSTNVNGGALILESGAGTGTGTNAIQFRTAPNTAATTADNVIRTVAYIGSDGAIKPFYGLVMAAQTLPTLVNEGGLYAVDVGGTVGLWARDEDGSLGPVAKGGVIRSTVDTANNAVGTTNTLLSAVTIATGMLSADYSKVTASWSVNFTNTTADKVLFVNVSSGTTNSDTVASIYGAFQNSSVWVDAMLTRTGATNGTVTVRMLSDDALLPSPTVATVSLPVTALPNWANAPFYLQLYGGSTSTAVAGEVRCNAVLAELKPWKN